MFAEVVSVIAHEHDDRVVCEFEAIERIEKDSDRDFFMGAAEAKAYGIIDEVYVRQKGLVNKDKEEKK